MKKRYLLSILLLCLMFLTYYVIEPFQFNPFAESPKTFTQSEIKQNHVGNQAMDLMQAKADSILDNTMVMNDFIGVSAGVYKEDQGFWLGATGYRNKRDQVETDTKTIHRIASISKPMTAIACLQLVERGLLDLDAPIEQYLKKLAGTEYAAITARQLLKHTSGVGHYRSTIDGISFKQYDSLVQSLDAFIDRPLSFEPGTAYEYSTYGYSILGAMIEEITGDYGAFLQENIWTPSGMTHTSIEKSEIEYDNKAELYIKWGEQYIKSPKTNLSVKIAGGGIQSTAEDLLKFGKAILDNRLIDSTSLAMMMNTDGNLKEHGAPYGMGWFIDEDPTLGKALRHGGSQSGASGYFKIYLDHGFAVAMLANDFGSDNEVYFASRELAHLFLNPEEADNSVDFYQAQSMNALERYVGSYEAEDFQQLLITKEKDQMMVRVARYPFVPIYPKSKDRFFYRMFNGGLKAIYDEQGMISAVMNTYEGDSKVYHRMR